MSEKSRLLIVEDNLIMRETLRRVLERDFEVETVDSGEACLRVLAEREKDLVLLDIVMPGIDGYETCRRLRLNDLHVPVIFVSAMDSLEERLRAFDSGGNDFILKPFDAQLLMRKVRKVVETQAERSRLAAEKNSLQQMAMGFLQNAGETGVLLNFMREVTHCSEYIDLAERMLQATRDYGLNCHIQIRSGDDVLSRTSSGAATDLEASILDQSAAMGRVFQFSRRLVVNYDKISVLVNDMPDDADTAGRIRDNVAILAESAEFAAEHIGLRHLAARRAALQHKAAQQSFCAIENLREMYRLQQLDTRFQLQHLIDAVEKSYVFLGLTESQERSLTEVVRDGSERVLQLLDKTEAFELEFSNILGALNETH